MAELKSFTQEEITETHGDMFYIETYMTVVIQSCSIEPKH